MAIICTLSVIAIIFYHLMIQYTHKPTTNGNQKPKPKTKAKILNHLLHCCIISAALYNIVTLCGYFGINTSSGTIHGSCYTMRTFYTIFYATNKTCIYYSYFLRLDVSFGGSSFEVNRCLLKLLYIATTIYFLVYITILPFDDKSDYEWNYKYNICRENDANFDSMFGLILTLAAVLYECIISITTLILFLKPLCYLSHVQNDENVHHLTIKVALLNGIIIISCITSLVWYSFISSTIIFMIDNVLNSLCLILMVNIHDKLYIKLCYLCISCKWCKFNDNVKNMSELSGTGVSSISL